MKQINLNISLVKNVPMLYTYDDGRQIGTMWDNRAQKLVFNRAIEFEDYDMLLLFKSGDDDWVGQNIGKDNNYVITNALTQNKTLKLQAFFIKGDACRYGTNAVFFCFRDAPQNGAVPEVIVSAQEQLLYEAIVKGFFDQSENLYKFKNMSGDLVLTLPVPKQTAQVSVLTNEDLEEMLQ